MNKQLKISIIISLMFVCFTGYGQDYSIKTYSLNSEHPKMTHFDSLMMCKVLKMDGLIPDSLKTFVDSVVNSITHGEDIDSSINTKFWIYDINGNVIGGSVINKSKIRVGEKFTLIDSITGNKYVLDKKHIHVTALDEYNKTIWRTDPFTASYMPFYRTTNPIIISFAFGRSRFRIGDEISEGEKVLDITFNSTQFGVIDLETGKFYWLGQD